MRGPAAVRIDDRVRVIPAFFRDGRAPPARPARRRWARGRALQLVAERIGPEPRHYRRIGAIENDLDRDGHAIESSSSRIEGPRLLRPSAFRPDIRQVATDRASVLCWSPVAAAAVGRCCCCHRCCQLGAARPVASRAAPCRGWPASGPGRLRPGPWSLTGVLVEAPASSMTSRVHSPGIFHLCSLPHGHSHA